MPEISVIVPVYKVEPYLRRCVDSILSQTFTDFELILVDDGSPDNCGAICDEYATQDERVHIIHQGNGGPSAARNAGIDWVFVNSNSEWISFVDSDDWILPEYLELLVSAVRTHHAQISMCWVYRTYGETPVIDATQTEAVLRSAEDAFTLNGKEVAAFAWGRLYARRLFEDVRFPQGRLFEDVFTIHRIILSQRFIPVIECGLYCYYVNPEGIVHSEKTVRRLKDEYDAYEAQISFLVEHGYEDIGRMQIRRYLSEVFELLKAMKQNAKSNTAQIVLLQEKKKKNFEVYAKMLNINDPADAWILTKIMPIRMHIYWYCRALCNKIRRLFSR